VLRFHKTDGVVKSGFLTVTRPSSFIVDNIVDKFATMWYQSSVVMRGKGEAVTLKLTGAIESSGPGVVESGMCSKGVEAIPGDISDDNIELST
jgi:hypothetical protein